MSLNILLLLITGTFQYESFANSSIDDQIPEHDCKITISYTTESGIKDSHFIYTITKTESRCKERTNFFQKNHFMGYVQSRKATYVFKKL